MIKEIHAEKHRLLVEQPSRFFDLLEDLEVRLPSWAVTAMLLVPDDRPNLEYILFEEMQDFFLYYTRRMIERPPPGRVHCFNIDLATRVWKVFVPPTLIGPNLKTKFRL